MGTLRQNLQASKAGVAGRAFRRLVRWRARGQRKGGGRNVNVILLRKSRKI